MGNAAVYAPSSIVATEKPVGDLAGCSLRVHLYNNKVQATLRTGDQIGGDVSLKVENETLQCSTIVIRLICRERACAQCLRRIGNSDTPNTRWVYECRDSELPVMEQTMAQIPGGQLARGSYSFPFLLAVPAGLAGTQGDVDKKNSSIHVDYLLEAELMHPHMDQSRARHSVELLNVAPSPVAVKNAPNAVDSEMQLLTDPVLNREPRPMSCMPCRYFGVFNFLTNVSVALSSAQLVAGETAVVRVSSSLPLTRVDLSLAEVVEPLFQVDSSVIWPHWTPVPLQCSVVFGDDNHAAGAPSGEVMQRGGPSPSASSVVPAAASTSNSHGSVITYTFVVPVRRPSYVGKLARVKHLLRVKLVKLLECNAVSATVDFPVTLYACRMQE